MLHQITFANDLAKYKKGQKLYAPDGGVKSVVVDSIKFYPTATIYYCHDTVTGTSHPYREDELFPLDKGDECLEVWTYMMMQMECLTTDQMKVEKAHSFYVLSPKILSGSNSRFAEIGFAIVNNEWLFFQNASEASMTRTNDPYDAYHSRIEEIKCSLAQQNIKVLDNCDNITLCSMFKTDAAHYVDWRSFVSLNINRVQQLRNQGLALI